MVLVFRSRAVGSNPDVANSRCRNRSLRCCCAAAAAAAAAAARSTQLSAKQLWVWVRIARLRYGAVRSSSPVRLFWSSHNSFVLFGSCLSSWSAPVPVALAQEKMKEARDKLAIARTGGGTGRLCIAPGAAAPGAWGDARVRAEGGLPRAPTSINFA